LSRPAGRRNEAGARIRGVERGLAWAAHRHSVPPATWLQWQIEIAGRSCGHRPGHVRCTHNRSSGLRPDCRDLNRLTQHLRCLAVMIASQVGLSNHRLGRRWRLNDGRCDSRSRCRPRLVEFGLQRRQARDDLLKRGIDELQRLARAAFGFALRGLHVSEIALDQQHAFGCQRIHAAACRLRNDGFTHGALCRAHRGFFSVPTL
jgi:hypothetical protein